MKPDQNTALADFWLHTATSALCDQARTRIAVEVRAHYADLVEAHLAEGMPLLDARLKALEDLGDGKVAARRFRKQHLTKNDEKSISLMLESSKVSALVFSFFLFAVSIFLISLSPIFRIELGIADFVAFVTFPVAASILARRVRGESGVAKALLSDMAAKIAGVLFIIILSFTIDFGSRFGPWLMIISWGMSPSFNAFCNYRLWKKFRREQKRRGEVLEAV